MKVNMVFNEFFFENWLNADKITVDIDRER